jgi:predicted XRE-type DNA-binding protein
MTKARTFANVWEAIEDSPEEAAAMTMRSNVMSVIKEKVHGWNTTQARAARRLGSMEPTTNWGCIGFVKKRTSRSTQ